MTATVEERELRCLLAKALQLNGVSELIVAKTLGYVEGIQDTKRQVEQTHEQTDRERPEEKPETNPD